jgi:hypothetical protein
MATAVRDGQLTPLEILDAHLDRIAALNPALNAIVALDAERARAAARTHNRQGTLAGVRRCRNRARPRCWSRIRDNPATPRAGTGVPLRFPAAPDSRRGV